MRRRAAEASIAARSSTTPWKRACDSVSICTVQPSSAKRIASARPTLEVQPVMTTSVVPRGTEASTAAAVIVFPWTTRVRRCGWCFRMSSPPWLIQCALLSAPRPHTL